MQTVRTPTIGDAPYRPKIDYKDAASKMKDCAKRLEEKAMSRVKVWRNDRG